MKKEGAFTLIEMIAVIVIIGIIVAVGIPAMSGLTRSAGLQGGVRQIGNAAALTRQFAITHRTVAELRIMQTGFSVFTNNVPVDKWNNLPIGVVVDNGGVTTSILFKPTGGLVAKIDQYIVVREGVTNSFAALVATNSNMSTVTVNAVLGRVSYP
jgi:prepilin-type N-terminal cleavage/methylation domain-containing protein